MASISSWTALSLSMELQMASIGTPNKTDEPDALEGLEGEYL
jgi:hypothetical protein